MTTATTNPNRWSIGLVGYGEVGRILSEDLREAGIAVAAYDIKLDGEQAAPQREHAAKFGVVLAKSHADLAGRAEDPIDRRVDPAELAAEQRALRRDVTRQTRRDELRLILRRRTFDDRQAHVI